MEVFRGIAAGIGGAVIFFVILAVTFGTNVTNLTEQSPEERSTSALEQEQQREQQAQQERERRALAQAQARAQAQDERRERARTASVLTLLREYGVIERYLITGVVVDGDDVTVSTRMFPKEDNAKFFAGACSQLVDQLDWIESVNINGLDDISHASWDKGESTCEVAGLRDTTSQSP